MAWPQATDYYDAIQNPKIAFKDGELRAGRPALNALGMPLPRSGNFADVYEVHSADQERCWAVKCFTRDMPDRERRFAAISHHLERRPLPFMVDFRYLADGILIGGVWFPVVKMRWIEGQTLNEFVKTRADKPQSLLRLAGLWRRLAHELREAGIAHGDLQHGNVLLVETSAGKLGLKLLDYDGMYVPALASIRSGEVGHPNFQHPQRARDGIYDFEVDRFAHLVIYLALRAVAASGPALWQRYDNGDNLLFREADFTHPAGSPLLRELLRAPEVTVQVLAGHILLAAEGDIRRVPLLTDVIREDGTAVPLTPDQVQELRGLLARSGTARVVPTLAAPLAADSTAPAWQTAPPPVRIQVPTSSAPPTAPPPASAPAPSRTRTRPPRQRPLQNVPIWARVFIVVGPVILLGLGGVVAISILAERWWPSTADRPSPYPLPTAAYRDPQPPLVRRDTPPRVPITPQVPPRSTPEPRKPADTVPPPSTTEPKKPPETVPPDVPARGSSDTYSRGQLVASFKHPMLDGRPGNRVSGVFFLDDHGQALSIGQDGSIRFWNLTAKREGNALMNVGAPTLNEVYRCAAMSPLRDKILIACDTGLAEIGWKDLSLRRIGYGTRLPPAVVSQVGYIRVGGGGQHAVLAGGPNGLRRWDLSREAIELNYNGVGHAPFAMTPSDGALIVQDLPGGNAAPVHYRMHDMGVVRRLAEIAAPITHLAIDNPAHNLIGSSGNGIITHWDVRTGERLVQKSFGGNVTVLALDGRGELGLCAGDDGNVKVFRLASSDAPMVLTGHTGAVRAATFAADRRQILTGGDDGTVKLWRLE